jgi:autotransporter-associated beta strand protein
MKSKASLRNFLTLAGTSLLAISYSHGQTILADSYLTSLDVSSNTTLYSSLNFPSYLDGALTGSSTLTTTGDFNSTLFLVNNGASNTFNGNIVVDSGTLRLSHAIFGTTTGGFTAPSMTSSNTITVNRAGTLYIDDNVTNGYTANRFGTAGSRPAVNLAGGRIDLNGLNNASSSVQTFGALTASSGLSVINVIRNSSGSPVLEFDSLTRASGAVVTFNDNNTSTLGTNSTSAPRILFTSTPTLTNGILAGARWHSPGSGGIGNFVTYGTDGIRQFTASDYTDVAGNDINLAAATNNVRFTGTDPYDAIAGSKTVNSLHIAPSANPGDWAMGGTLTLTSGMLMKTGHNHTTNITSGTLTAGNGIDDIDLHIMIQQNNMTFSGTSVIADNGDTAVTLVKSEAGNNTLSLTSNSDNTYTGGTYVLAGQLTTGNTANRRYLGTGKVTVNNGILQLGNIGATSNATGDDYTAINGAQINIASGAAGAYTAADTFNIGAGSVISGGSASGQGLASLTRGTNITLADGAIIAHGQQTAALNLTTGTIQNLGTNADVFYGLNNNQNSATGAITIGSGTAFQGISTDRSARAWQQGTINIASGTTSVDFQGLGTPGANAQTLTLGNGGTAGAPVISFAGTGTVDIRALGPVALNDDTATYGATGAAVRFVATAGSTLTVSTGTGMGSGTGIASALVQSGGSLAIGNTAALNGAVTVEASGRLLANQASGLTGSGALTFDAGSIIDITNATGFSGAQATAASIAAGTIVRLNANFGAAGDTLDSYLSTNSPIYQVFGGDRGATNPTAPDTTILTLNRTAGGIGGILTNDLASRTFGSTTNGRITLGANGGVMAMTTGTSMNINEDIHGSGPLIIGATDIIDGAPKLGTVNLNTNTNAFTGGVIINAGTLRAGVANTLGTSLTNQVTVNTGGTLDMSPGNQTIGNLTGTGGIINAAGRVLTIGQGDTGGGNYQGSIQGAGGALTKTGTGTITLSGANTYTGATAVNGGSLIINGSTSTSAVAVNSTGTLGGIGTVGGTTNINSGGTLSPGQSPGTLNFTGNLNMLNGSIYLYEAGDLADVNGTLDLDNNWTLKLGSGFQDDAAGFVTLFEFTSLAGSPDLDPTIDITSLGFTPSTTLTIAQFGSTLRLNGISAIPEPSAAFLGALGALMLLRRRRA